MAVVKKEPIFFDAIVERIMYAVKKSLGNESSFKLLHETYEDYGMIWWRSCVIVDGGVTHTSRRHHTCAGDALRELAEIIDCGP